MATLLLFPANGEAGRRWATEAKRRWRGWLPSLCSLLPLPLSFASWSRSVGKWKNIVINLTLMMQKRVPVTLQLAECFLRSPTIATIGGLLCHSQRHNPETAIIKWGERRNQMERKRSRLESMAPPPLPPFTSALSLSLPPALGPPANQLHRVAAAPSNCNANAFAVRDSKSRCTGESTSTSESSSEQAKR
nr:hypothetical protein Iba_chr02eCG5760 [Ipomoea batatas]